MVFNRCVSVDLNHHWFENCALPG